VTSAVSPGVILPMLDSLISASTSSEFGSTIVTTDPRVEVRRRLPAQPSQPTSASLEMTSPSNGLRMLV